MPQSGLDRVRPVMGEPTRVEPRVIVSALGGEPGRGRETLDAEAERRRADRSDSGRGPDVAGEIVLMLPATIAVGGS